MPDEPAGTDLPELHDAQRERLRAALALRPRGFFADVDGTLSAIAPTPEAAVLLPGVRELLEALRTRFAVVAAVSGRSARDTWRLVGVPGITYIGNHGLERLDPSAALESGTETLDVRVLPEALPYLTALSALLASITPQLERAYPGLRVEPKGVTASIHVRGTADPAAAERAVLDAVAEPAAAHGLRVTRGKLVVELRPPVAVDKGVAVSGLIEEARLRSALYLGDDRTDIDAFRALRRLRALGRCDGIAVAVLHAEAPPDLAAEADITLSSVERVPAFLRWLVAQSRS